MCVKIVVYQDRVCGQNEYFNLFRGTYVCVCLNASVCLRYGIRLMKFYYHYCYLNKRIIAINLSYIRPAMRSVRIKRIISGFIAFPAADNRAREII